MFELSLPLWGHVSVFVVAGGAIAVAGTKLAGFADRLADRTRMGDAVTGTLFLGEEGRSIASSNHYLRAIKMFTRWLVTDKRTNDNCLAHLAKLNEGTDGRRICRPLSMDEFTWLLKAAQGGPEIQHVTGVERTVIYIVGVYTGYRRIEIGSVTRRSFDFDSESDTLTVEAGSFMHRRKDVIPFRHDFATRIRDWIELRLSQTSAKPACRRRLPRRWPAIRTST